MKVVVAGIVCSGKIDVANQYGNVIKTDDFMFLDWSEQSEFLQHLFSLEKSSFTLEGVSSIRALRKWLKNNDGKPCDKLHILTNTNTQLTPHQQSASKGVINIFNGIKDELIKRGVEVVESQN